MRELLALLLDGAGLDALAARASAASTCLFSAVRSPGTFLPCGVCSR